MAEITLPASTNTVNKGNQVRPVWYTFFSRTFDLLLGSFETFPSGVLYINNTTTGNIGAGIDTIANFDFATNTLDNNGDLIEIEAWGNFASNNNNKNIDVKFGSTTILTTGALAFNNTLWKLNIKISKKDDSSQEIFAHFTSNFLLEKIITINTTSEDITGTISFKIDSTGVSDNDIENRLIKINLTSNF